MASVEVVKTKQNEGQQIIAVRSECIFYSARSMNQTHCAKERLRWQLKEVSQCKHSRVTCKDQNLVLGPL